MKNKAAFALIALLSSAAFAQQTQQPTRGPTATPDAPLQLTVAQAPGTVLPANTQLTLAMNQEVTTKGKRWNEGDTFDMTITHDVMLGNYIVIPKGSRGVGRITWLTNKGAFGKSGKMEIDMEYAEVAGRRIPITGNYPSAIISRGALRGIFHPLLRDF